MLASIPLRLLATPCALLITLLSSAGCCGAPRPAGGKGTATPIRVDEVQAVLDVQREAWNRGDLEGFMATYERSEQLGFVGSSGLTRGWDRTLANYRRGYPDAAARGRLDFELVAVRPLGDEHAIVVGRFHLERSAPADGWFTLLVARSPAGLVILHDHSSEASTPRRT